MAQYLVTYKGQKYASRDLVKALFKVGDAGVLSLLSSKCIALHTILDRVVYKLADNTCLDGVHISTQGIEEQTAQFVKAEKDDERYEIPRPKETYTLDGIEYIRLQDMNDFASKYRVVNRLPYIVFLGRKYIAVGVKYKDEPCRVATLKSTN